MRNAMNEEDEEQIVLIKNTVMIPANGKAAGFPLVLTYRIPLLNEHLIRFVPQGTNTERWVVISHMLAGWDIETPLTDESLIFFINSHPGAFDIIFQDWCKVREDSLSRALSPSTPDIH